MKASTENETLNINCGRGAKDIVYLKKGWNFVFENGIPGRMSQKDNDGKTTEVECWCDTNDLKVKLTCPAEASGKLLLHIVDADKLGRAEKVFINGREMGTYSDFGEGKWIELQIDKTVTKDGAISVDIKPDNTHDAVVSNIRFEAE